LIGQRRRDQDVGVGRQPRAPIQDFITQVHSFILDDIAERVPGIQQLKDVKTAFFTVGVGRAVGLAPR
jgi:hypothetical protein